MKEKLILISALICQLEDIEPDLDEQIREEITNLFEKTANLFIQEFEITVFTVDRARQEIFQLTKDMLDRLVVEVVGC